MNAVLVVFVIEVTVGLEAPAFTSGQKKGNNDEFFERMDVSADGFVDFVEFRGWLDQEAIADEWARINPGPIADNTISWQQYKIRAYPSENPDKTNVDSDPEMHTMMERDKRRWDTADEDGDGRLNKTEFAVFTYPEASRRLQHLVVAETLDDYDADSDGRVSTISLQEFLDFVYVGGESEPEWVAEERKEFEQDLDRNKDGFLDAQEVRDWVLQDGEDRREMAELLLREGDTDGDLRLARHEVLAIKHLLVKAAALQGADATTTKRLNDEL
ncbi:unnamed protein product [Notodromas monacha]|uniref:EF-hand domain-containing protein n=1 Tax=Notodromas monacha TaxID=399045 RepID=A0A7R9GA91_9CRUS|nr:unnamed protein product [Notodromas monacha]CAG0915085.1 unnamed protein product [Notodromas monacha]